MSHHIVPRDSAHGASVSEYDGTFGSSQQCRATRGRSACASVQGGYCLVCDVSAAFEGKATPAGIAVGNHCVLILDEAQRGETLALLGGKRERAK